MTHSPAFLNILRFTLCTLSLVLFVSHVQQLEAEDQIPEDATWADIRNERWPGEAPGEEEFGPAFDGVRMAARPLLQFNPRAESASIAIWVENANDFPMSFYGWGWTADLLPATIRTRGESARIGGPKPTWYGTMTIPPQSHIAYVVAAEMDGHAAKDRQQIVKLHFHHVPGLSKWAPGKVMDRGYLMSAPIQVKWPQKKHPGLTKLQKVLKKALDGDKTADKQFMKHEHAVPALETTWLEGQVKKDDLLEYILRRPNLQADHLAIDLLCSGGPWTWTRVEANSWAWKMVEWEVDQPGICTQQRARFTMGLADLIRSLLKGRKNEYHGLDTASAIYAWNMHWKDAIATQHRALDRGPKDNPEAVNEMAKRLALLYALQAMNPFNNPGPFAYDAIAGDPSARDGLLPLLSHKKSQLKQAARKLLEEHFPGEIDKLK